MQFVQNYSIMHLSYLFNDENNAFNFAVQKNMIYNILNCNDCGIQLKINIKNFHIILNALNAKGFILYYIKAFFIIQKFQ